MPHVIYLHSALTQRRVVGRTAEERKKIFRFETIDVVIAMGLAGVINMSMLSMAAALFHANGLTGVADIDKAFEQMRVLEGSGMAILFGLALLSSGLSSSSVGMMAGQVVMQGFINRRIPLFLRRLITMIPALTILAVGLNPSRSLVISQVVLSFGIPFALIPLLLFCRNRNLMGGVGQPPPDHRSGYGGGHVDRLPQRVPPLPDLLRLRQVEPGPRAYSPK
jgi:manganese transport protein